MSKKVAAINPSSFSLPNSTELYAHSPIAVMEPTSWQNDPPD